MFVCGLALHLCLQSEEICQWGAGGGYLGNKMVSFRIFNMDGNKFSLFIIFLHGPEV
jgi:hypothetical protein